MAAPGRVQSIQGLRGVAAAMVVVAHAYEHGAGDGFGLSGVVALLGVKIFFVISGFVIALVTSGGRFDPVRFALRRIIRIVPLYWALTLLLTAVLLAAPGAFKTTVLDAGYLLKSLVFVPAALPGTDDFRPIFKPGWTLNYEMAFYACVLLTFWMRRPALRVLLLTAALGGLVGYGAFARPQPGPLDFYSRQDLLPFAGGLWLALLWRAGVFARLGGSGGGAVLAAALAAVARVLLFPAAPPSQLEGAVLLVVASLLAVAAGLAFERRFADVPVAGWLGDISYSLYLVHMFVVGAGWAVLHRMGVSAHSGAGAIGVLLILAAAVGVAHLSFRWFEQPIARWENARFRRPATRG